MKLNNIKIGKFNILDIVIMLIILLFIIIFAINKISDANAKSSDTLQTSVGTTFSYKILIEGLSKTSADAFKSGDSVYDKISNVYIGKIENINIMPAKGLIDKNNGEIIESEIPGKIDVELEITTNGTIKEGEYLANDLIRIMVGNLKQIKTKYVMCMSTVTGIEK